ncbi:MAG: hypothetical protein R3E87_26690 [Burkholderiaceae bacterium]
MVLGLIVAWVAITVSQPYQASVLSPAAAVWIVAVPVADMFTCMIRRIGEGKTPMTADRHHLHHMLLEMGVPARRAVYLLWLLSLLCGAVGVGGTWLGLPEYLMLWALVLLFAMYTRFSIKFWRKRRRPRLRLPSDLSDPGPVTPSHWISRPELPPAGPSLQTTAGCQTRARALAHPPTHRR